MSRNIQLYRALDFEAAWNNAALPWFEQTSQTAWRSNVPTAVLIPSMTYAQFLKSQILDAGLNLLGILFLTPGECWKILHERLGIKLNAASREDLHLLLSSAAEQFPETPSARSIARDSSDLMRSLDQLAAAGWQASELEISEGSFGKAIMPILTNFAEYLDEAGLNTAQVIDKELIKEANKHAPVFSSLLVIGFGGNHWPLWNMLNAAVSASETATVCLFEPRLTAEVIDQVWINSWEEAHGEAEILPGQDKSKPRSCIGAGLTEAIESGNTFPGNNITLHIGNDVEQQALAILAQAFVYLTKNSCTRLGIIFPSPGPLSRETARLLASHGIPHNDSLGHNGQSEIADLPWQAWLSFQKQPGVQQFLSFIRLCPQSADLLGISQDQIEPELRKAYEELMVDNLPVLAAYLNWQFNKKWLSLPDRASLQEFLVLTKQAVAGLAEGSFEKCLGGFTRIAVIEEKAALFSDRWQKPFSRDIYLRWLNDVTQNVRRIKNDAGTHPYARVQLLPYDKAEWQTFSHLILAGLNRNHWPPEYRHAPFLGQDLIDRLNRKALKQGSQGEGQLIVKPGKGVIIGPSERSAQVRCQFYNLIESAREGICLTAARTEENDISRKWTPSDLLVRVYAATTGTGLSDEIIDNLSLSTSKWLNESDCRAGMLSNAKAARRINGGKPFGHSRPTNTQFAIERTARAFLARRNENEPFGPYEFALNSPPKKPITLSCTAWEKAFMWPEIVWMKYLPGVEDEAWSPSEIPWAKVIGLWVHRWLSSAFADWAARDGVTRSAAFHPLPSPDSVRAGLNRGAEKTRGKAERAFNATGLPLPDWWAFLHTQARSMAERIANNIPEIIAQGWKSCITEWTLAPDSIAYLPSGTKLRLHGRIDLVLSQSDQGPYWIIDYKTGTGTKPTPSSLAKGEGLQILLYALALKSRGIKKILLTLARPGEETKIQVDADELLNDERVAQTLEILGKMQETGIFGMKGDPHAEFGFVPNYPLATLRIDPEILEKKWNKTFLKDN